jgi:hypothetical protein
MPRKKSNSKILEDRDEEIIYSQEEAEFLGYSGPELDDDSDEDMDDEDLDEDEDSEEDYEDLESRRKREIKLKKDKKAADKERHYVEPKEFDKEIVNYYNTDIISDNLAEMISKIAHKLSYASNFVNYTYREEMVGDGIVRMFKALTSKKYDRVKGTNPFSYFTRIAFNAFRNRIKKEKHMRAVHEKYQEELLMFSANYNSLMKNNQIKIQRDKRRDD